MRSTTRWRCTCSEKLSPLWQMIAANKRAVYVCINRGDATCPRDIAERSVLIDADIAAVLRHASQETSAA